MACGSVSVQIMHPSTLVLTRHAFDQANNPPQAPLLFSQYPQDREDDVKVGIKSTALTLGDWSRPALAGFSLGTAALLTAAGVQADCVGPYYAGVALAGAMLARQVATVDFDNREDCGSKFVSNKWVGAAVLAGIVADRLLA